VDQSTTRQTHHGPHRQGYAARTTPDQAADQQEHRRRDHDLGITETSA
jgi:hypothetical protein